MRCCQALFLMATLLFAAAGLQAQQAPLDIKDSDIDVRLEFVESPRIGADNVAPMPSSGLSNQKWLEILVTYTMPLRIDQRTKQVEWLDEMSITAKVIVPAEYMGSKVKAIITGKQTFQSVPCDGKKHHASLFVSPVILSRYTPADFKLNKSAAKDIPAIAIFMTQQQKAIGTGVQIPRGVSLQQTAALFKEAETSLGVLKLENSILPREQTPWAHLDFDSFDMPKPAGSK